MTYAQLTRKFYSALAKCESSDLSPAFSLLDELKFDKDVLFVKEHFGGSIGGETHLCAIPRRSENRYWDREDMQVNKATMFEFIETPYTEAAFWQAFLLHMAYTQLPLFWHGLYEEIDFIFSRADWRRVKEEATSTLFRSDPAVADRMRFTPKVELIDEGAIITFYAWNDWRGLYRESVVVRRDYNGTCSFDEPSRKTIVKYDCMICF